MCTAVLLRRPGHRWPLLLAANRDEMLDRPWRPPARHWPDRREVVAGLDELAGGTWMGINDYGLLAVVLNRRGSLGPQDGRRSRGELPLEALDHADALTAAGALASLDSAAYRSFNLIVADRDNAFWLCSRADGAANGRVPPVEVHPLPPGISMITASDRNDLTSPRIRAYLGRFEKAPAPDPDVDDWAAWATLLGSRTHDVDAGPDDAMNIVTDRGFGTVCSTLLAIRADVDGTTRTKWLFAAGRPDEAPFAPVEI